MVTFKDGLKEEKMKPGNKKLAWAKGYKKIWIVRPPVLREV